MMVLLCDGIALRRVEDCNEARPLRFFKVKSPTRTLSTRAILLVVFPIYHTYVRQYTGAM